MFPTNLDFNEMMPCSDKAKAALAVLLGNPVAAFVAKNCHYMIGNRIKAAPDSEDVVITDADVIQYASAVRDAVQQLIDALTPEPLPPCPISGTALQTLLLLVNVTMDVEELNSWPQKGRDMAAAWASAVHLAANDNDVAEIPFCPYRVAPEDTLKRLAADLTGETKTWDVVRTERQTGGDTFERQIGKLTVPAYIKYWDVCRLAYAQFKTKLQGQTWMIVSDYHRVTMPHTGNDA